MNTVGTFCCLHILLTAVLLMKSTIVWGMDVSRSFQSADVIPISGPWELYRCHLLFPADQPPPHYIESPAAMNWTKVTTESCGTAAPSFGTGTYRIRLKGFEKSDAGYQVMLKLAFTSYRMFLFPEAHPERFQEAKSGKVAPDSSTVPAYSSNILSFRPEGPDEAWILLIQVANFHHYRGGLMFAPLLGKGSALGKEYHLDIESSLACIGVMAFMFVYTFMLYRRRPEDKSSLFLSLTCFMIMIRVILTSNLVYYYTDQPSIHLYQFHLSLEYITVIGGPIAYLLFSQHTFGQVNLSRIVKLFTWINLAFIAAIVALPIYWKGFLLSFLQALVAIELILMMKIVFTAVRNKSEGAWFALAGDLVMIFCVSYDILISVQVLPRTIYLTQFGACIFLFLQGQLVARRFATAFRTAETLQKQLQVEVDRQTEELSSMMKNIPQGIFVILSDFTIQRNYSHHLEVILDCENLQGRPALPTLFGQSSLTTEQIDLANSALVASFSEESFVWEMNASNLPTSFWRNSEHGQKTLELDWNPIINREGRVDRVLVSVRDVTQVKALEMESARQKSQFDMIRDLLQSDRKAVVEFFREGSRLLGELQGLIGETSYVQNDLGRMCFLKLHSFKGLARSYGLKRLTRVVHDVEQTLVKSQKDGWKGWEPSALKVELASIIQVFQDYEKLMDEKLGWNSNMETSEFSVDELNDLDQKFRYLLAKPFPWGNEAESLIVPLSDFLDRHLMVDLRTFLQSFRRDLGSLAAELGKPEPRLVITGDEVRMMRAIEVLMRTAILHLLRNSMDHGLESTVERSMVSKSEQGSIKIDIRLDGDLFRLAYEDDGRGLDLLDIRRTAQEKGIVEPKQSLSSEEVAALIFHPGLSTKKIATEVSGRGIGMDAIRSLFEEAGGTVGLVLSPHETTAGSARVAFKLLATLPARYFRINGAR